MCHCYNLDKQLRNLYYPVYNNKAKKKKNCGKAHV